MAGDKEQGAEDSVCNEDRGHNFALSNVISVIKSRTVRWVWGAYNTHGRDEKW
jgi:hypothetical protein